MIQILTFILLLMSNSNENTSAESSNKLIYFGDPMCSWCYGFSPEITEVVESMSDTIDFELVMGGLRPNGQETMAELGDFLKSHWVEIEERTGQGFSYDILQQRDFVYNTEPACRAVVVASKIAKGKEFAFFKEVQKAFYFENKDTRELSTYLAIAKKLEIDEAVFETTFKGGTAFLDTQKHFEFSGSIGVNSFPTLVLKKGEEYHLVARGYAKSATILKAIESILEE